MKCLKCAKDVVMCKCQCPIFYKNNPIPYQQYVWQGQNRLGKSYAAIKMMKDIWRLRKGRSMQRICPHCTKYMNRKAMAAGESTGLVIYRGRRLKTLVHKMSASHIRSVLMLRINRDRYAAQDVLMEDGNDEQ